jgi:hypothetical protein
MVAGGEGRQHEHAAISALLRDTKETVHLVGGVFVKALSQAWGAAASRTKTVVLALPERPPRSRCLGRFWRVGLECEVTSCRAATTLCCRKVVL